jgi:HK97 family phage portal protein
MAQALSRHPQRRAIQLARRAEVKAAEFHPALTETIRQLGGWYCGSYGEMYRRQPAVRAAVDFLSRNVAQLNAKVYERIDTTDRLEVPDHPLAKLLRHPNPATTRYAHMRDTVADLAVYDRAYWIKMRQGRQFAVRRYSPAKMMVEVIETAAGMYQRVYRTSTGVEVPRAQLVVFSGYSPDSDDEGVSPLETLRRVLSEEQAAQQNRENMWRNAARQSGFIERPLEAPEWSDTARQRFRADIESTLAGGANAGRIGVLEEGMSWNGNSFSPEETSYIAGRRLTYEEVAIVYGLDPSIIGMGNETKANAAEYHKQAYQDVLGPWLRMLQDEIELQLLPEFEPLGTSTTYVEFNLAEKLKGSFEQQAEVLTTSVGVPIMTPNEGRARLNLPRIDDEAYDLPIQPMNVIYGGQPAVAVPTEVPSAAPELAAAEPPDPWQDVAVKRHAELLRRHFDRQSKAILSAKGVQTVDDVARWDRELAQDLLLLAVRTLPAADLAGLDAETRRAAEAINAGTTDAILGTDFADLRDTLEAAKESRVDELAAAAVAALAGYAVPV